MKRLAGMLAVCCLLACGPEDRGEADDESTSSEDGEADLFEPCDPVCSGVCANYQHGGDFCSRLCESDADCEHANGDLYPAQCGQFNCELPCESTIDCPGGMVCEIQLCWWPEP